MSTSAAKQALVLLAHGSRDRDAHAEYTRLWQAVAERVSVPVQFGVLEFPSEELPSIADAVRRCAEAGVERVSALPFFLFAAGHVREDIPEELEAAAAEHGVRLAYEPPLGVHPNLLDVVADRAAEAAATLSGGGDEPYAVVLVGAGTSDPQSNADLYRTARLIWERRQHPLVEVGFVSLTEPSVADVLVRCHALGWRRVVLAPYFLNTGVLARRIRARLAQAQTELPDLEVAVAEHFGLHPRLVDLVVERAELALAREPERASSKLPPCAVSGRPWECQL